MPGLGKGLHRIIVAAALAVQASMSWGLSIALRAPMDVNNPSSLDADSVDTGLAQVNPLGGLLVLTEGYAVTTQAFAHDTLGITAGRAGFGLIGDRPGHLPAAFAEANITGTGKLSGGPNDLIPVTVAFNLHGRFIGLDGTPEVSLRGTLAVNGFTSAIDWVVPAGLDAVQTTTWAFEGNDPSQFYAGAQPLVVSSTSERLDGQARVSFSVPGGTEIFVEADLQGSARPAYTVLGVSSAGDGQVDFSNTGILRVTLGAGASFVDATGALASATVVSAVPEPVSALLLLCGLATIGFIRARRDFPAVPAS